MAHLVIPKREPAPPIKIAPLQRALEAAQDPAEIKEIAAQLDAFETYMHDCGLYSIEDMRPINETRMRARWKLGRALKMVRMALCFGRAPPSACGAVSISPMRRCVLISGRALNETTHCMTHRRAQQVCAPRCAR